MKLSRAAGVLWMEWMFRFTRSSRDELAALSSFMLLQEKKNGVWGDGGRKQKNQECELTGWSRRGARASARVASPAPPASCTSSRCSRGPPHVAWPPPSWQASSSPAPPQTVSCRISGLVRNVGAAAAAALRPCGGSHFDTGTPWRRKRSLCGLATFLSLLCDDGPSERPSLLWGDLDRLRLRRSEWTDVCWGLPPGSWEETSRRRTWEFETAFISKLLAVGKTGSRGRRHHKIFFPLKLQNWSVKTTRWFSRLFSSS